MPGEWKSRANSKQGGEKKDNPLRGEEKRNDDPQQGGEGGPNPQQIVGGGGGGGGGDSSPKVRGPEPQQGGGRDAAHGGNSFKHPIHMSPENMAHSYTCDPFVSLKIDGLFQGARDIKREDYDNFDPPLPPHWYNIEGELYRPSADVPPILYIFKIDKKAPESGILGQVTKSLQQGKERGAILHQLRFTLRADKVGLVIGKGGETIKHIKATYKVDVVIDKENVPGSDPPVKFVTITGLSDNAIGRAFEFIKNLVNPPVLVALKTDEMMKEIKDYFCSCNGDLNVHSERSSSSNCGGGSAADSPQFSTASLYDLFRADIETSFTWRDRPYPRRTEQGLPVGFAYDKPENIFEDIACCRWYPKMYRKLVTEDLAATGDDYVAKWNAYVTKLHDFFRNICSQEFKELIKHDGLVITPNDLTGKKSIIKLKPKDEMTIDLKLESKEGALGEWLSGLSPPDNKPCSMTHLVEVDRERLESLVVGRVYRLYPTASNKFTPGEIREETKSANGAVHCSEIHYKLMHYFEIGDLVDIYKCPPWYSQDGANEVRDINMLYLFTQKIYKSIIQGLVSPLRSMREKNLLDIGCGSGGQYHAELKEWKGAYVGIDIDFGKLHVGQLKFNPTPNRVVYKARNIEFLPINIAIPWTNVMQSGFFNDRRLWDRYYRDKFAEFLEANASPSAAAADAGVFTGISSISSGGGSSSSSSSSVSDASVDAATVQQSSGIKFDVVLSIFSSQYSNATEASWAQYVHEINSRTNSGSYFFLMFMDGDKVEAMRATCDHLIPPSADRGELLVLRSPQGGEHREPVLRTSHVMTSFVNNSSAPHRWEQVPDSTELQAEITNVPEGHHWKCYTDAISWIVLRKL